MTLTSIEIANAEEDVASLAAVVNGSASDPDVVTRLGRVIKPLAKVIAEASGSGGFEPPVAFGAGLNMVRSSQTVTYLDATYSASPAAIPFITTGVFDPTQWNLLVVKNLLTRAELKALAAPADGTILMMIDGAKTGVFKYTTANIKPLCDADPLEGLFVKRTGTDGSTGGWARNYDGPTISRWWGVATTNTAAQNVTAMRAALTSLDALALTTFGYVDGVAPLYTPAGHYLLNDEIKPESAVEIFGDSTLFGNGTIFEWTGSSGHGFYVQGWDGASRHGAGSVIRNLHLKGWFAGARAVQHGIKVNGAVKVEDVYGENWPGNLVDAFADVTGPNGNASNSTFRNIYSQFCDLTLKIQGPDVNICLVEHIQAQANRLGCYWDWSFLGCSATAIYAENCGLENNFRSRCHVGGHIYVVAYGQEVWCSTNAPSGTKTSNQGWLYLTEGGTNFYTATWVTGQTWYFTSPISIGPPDNGNTLGRAEGCYVEGGMNPIILGPLASCTTTTASIIWCDADLATHHGTLHGGTSRASYETMVLGNGLTVPGLITQLGPRQELGATSGVAADFDMNFHCSNFSVRLNATRHDSDGTPHTMGDLIWFNGSAFYDAVFGHNFRVGATSVVQITTTALQAMVDNAYTIGGPGARFSEAYIANNVINTSDKRLKTNIAAPDDKLLDAWADVKWMLYQLKEAVAKKGEDKARLHVGLIAQHVRETFERHGLDGFRYGLLCYDEWAHRYEPEFAEETYATEVKIPVLPPPWEIEKHPRYRDYHASLTLDQQRGYRVVRHDSKRVVGQVGRDGKPKMKIAGRAGNLYGIRYEQALALEAAFQRRRADRIENRLGEIERKVQLLTA